MKKQKRYTPNRDKTASPKFIKPKNTRGEKRYYIIALLSEQNDIHIELTNNRQKALLFVKNVGKIIFIKTFQDKRNANALQKEYVQKYNHAPAKTFNSLNNINI